MHQVHQVHQVHQAYRSAQYRLLLGENKYFARSKWGVVHLVHLVHYFLEFNVL